MPRAEFPYLGIIAKIQFSCIPWIATALSNSTFINYVNITFPCWNGLIKQENLILAYYAQIWKFGPGHPKMEFFKNFSFLWKGLQISLLTGPQPPQTLSLSQVMQENVIMPKYGNSAPGSQKWNFSKKIHFFEKVSRFRFQRALNHPRH